MRIFLIISLKSEHKQEIFSSLESFLLTPSPHPLPPLPPPPLPTLVPLPPLPLFPPPPLVVMRILTPSSRRNELVSHWLKFKRAWVNNKRRNDLNHYDACYFAYPIWCVYVCVCMCVRVGGGGGLNQWGELTEKIPILLNLLWIVSSVNSAVLCSQQIFAVSGGESYIHVDSICGNDFGS